MNNNAILTLADEYKAAKEAKKNLEAELKDVNTRIEELSGQLSQLMTDEELDKFSRNGSTFYLTTRLFASPRADRKQELFSRLREYGYGSLIVPQVNSNTLASFVKEQMENNGDEIPEWIDEVVNTHQKVSVGIRKG